MNNSLGDTFKKIVSKIFQNWDNVFNFDLAISVILIGLFLIFLSSIALYTLVKMIFTGGFG